jgi:hypothetical protein
MMTRLLTSVMFVVGPVLFGEVPASRTIRHHLCAPIRKSSFSSNTTGTRRFTGTTPRSSTAFSPTSSSSPTTTAFARIRNVELELAKSLNENIESSMLDEFIVKEYGNTAVVLVHAAPDRSHNGQRVQNDYRFTDVFVLRDGRWQCLSSQSTHVARAPRPNSVTRTQPRLHPALSSERVVLHIS